MPHFAGPGGADLRSAPLPTLLPTARSARAMQRSRIAVLDAVTIL
jgi:hypothetical protein